MPPGARAADLRAASRQPGHLHHSCLHRVAGSQTADDRRHHVHIRIGGDRGIRLALAFRHPPPASRHHRTLLLDDGANLEEGRLFGLVVGADGRPTREHRDGLGICLRRLACPQSSDLTSGPTGPILAERRRSPILRRRLPTPINARVPMSRDIKKVVLAYSGGLDTSVILKWLQEHYRCAVVTFTADLGQGEELEPARKKAQMLGIKEIFVEDLREEFVRDFVFPMFRANALYEGQYLLGTSIARPLIAKRQIDIAKQTGADAVAHGATGKGNDQVRFELSYYALNPDIKVIAPWREWDLTSRTRLLDFAEKHQIPVAKDKRGEAPFSIDANLLHSSSEGKVLEDPAQEPPPYVYQRTLSPEEAPDKAVEITIGFERGNPVSINGTRLSPAALLTDLNAYGKETGIGRVDLVENRFVGMKSRGIYETPGGTILYVAHRAIESLTLDREAMHLKDSLMPRYAELVYYGFWFSPEREMIQALIDKSQEHVEGEVRLKLYKRNGMMAERARAKALYSDKIVTFEDDAGAYDQKDA